MAVRDIQTNLIVTGADEYITTIERVTTALRAASEAKKEFDALFGQASNPADD